LDEQDSLVHRRMVIECQEDTLHDRHRGDRPGSSVRCSSSPRDTEAAEAVAPWPLRSLPAVEHQFVGHFFAPLPAGSPAGDGL